METMEEQLKKLWFDPESKSVEQATSKLIGAQKDNFFSENKKSMQPEIGYVIEKYLEVYKKEEKKG